MKCSCLNLYKPLTLNAEFFFICLHLEIVKVFLVMRKCSCLNLYKLFALALSILLALALSILLALALSILPLPTNLWPGL